MISSGWSCWINSSWCSRDSKCSIATRGPITIMLVLATPSRRLPLRQALCLRLGRQLRMHLGRGLHRRGIRPRLGRGDPPAGSGALGGWLVGGGFGGRACEVSSIRFLRWRRRRRGSDMLKKVYYVATVATVLCLLSLLMLKMHA
jgi:hypothetical protein